MSVTALITLPDKEEFAFARAKNNHMQSACCVGNPSPAIVTVSNCMHQRSVLIAYMGKMPLPLH